ncbi:hypothetical protein BDV25DRAFT_47563 [Aspergillus avenaceus]|uniref:Zn(2)-C6 fungal-type domain-containing protein n=1 Tax=Aspergillus avenaceus TaxID=36643 RepID=A0A5N6U2X1_ASPAV|nr:hypothetical protein BDV25DRAFT_47563 [Aspergillus avenaceus]
MGGFSESSQPKRIRIARAPRSKSGCRTCRIRHVKCDESPGRCFNCVSTGRQCDGYDLDRLPPKNGPAGGTTLSVHRMRLVLPDQTSDERRCFSYFQCSTIPMINVWFDHNMWDRLTLQMSHAEPAICHAVVAVSALQQLVATTGMPVLPEDMTNRYHRFALGQYNRAVSHLISRMNSNDPSVKNMALVCCLLFVVFELTWGRYDVAILHLQNGVKLLGSQAQKPLYTSLYHTHPSSALERHIEPSFAAAIMHLDLQSAHFGVSKLHDGLDLEMFAHRVGHGPSTLDFQTIQDAWIVRDRIFIQFCMFGNLCESFSAADICANYGVLRMEQRKQQAQLAGFAQALDRFEAASIHRRCLTGKERRALAILRMHHAALSVITDVCLVKCSDTICSMSMERFNNVVVQAKSITHSLMEIAPRSTPHCPTLLMETGTIAPLFFVIAKCDHPGIQQSALVVLESWPHREGLWDSQLAATLARQKMGRSVH